MTRQQPASPASADGPGDVAGPSPLDGLPFIDEHRTVIAAPADVVWDCLTRLVAHQHMTGTPLLVRVVGARPRQASGTPLDAGASVPGFAVAESEQGQRLRLAGRHHFSRYSLSFTLDGRPEGTVLAARSHAEFPGATGFLYRQLVIGSGAHKILVRRMLESVRRHAEAAAHA